MLILRAKFKVTKIHKKTIRKGFKDISVGDIFDIESEIKRHHGSSGKTATWCTVKIKGERYDYSFNELSDILNNVYDLIQIS